MEVWVGKGRKGDSDVVHREDDTQLLAGERGLQRGRVEESPAANDGEEEAVEVLVDAPLMTLMTVQMFRTLPWETARERMISKR